MAKGDPGFNGPIMYKGKPVEFDQKYTKVDLIMCKNQPRQDQIKLDMRYKVNRDFINWSKKTNNGNK